MTVVDQAQLVEPIVAEWARLEDHIEILSGFPFDSKLFSPTEGTPLIRIRDIVRGRTETHYTGTYEDKFVITDGDLLIGMDGDFNRATWSSGPALLNQRVCKVTANPGSLDDRYLYHFLPIPLMDIWHQTPFATVKHLSVKGIRGIQIPLPPLPEQRRIGAILDKADHLRTQRREALAHLDALTQSIFDDLFGVLTDQHALVTIQDVADVQGGLQVTKKRDALPDRASYLRVANVYRGWLKLDEIKTIGLTAAERKRTTLQNGDLLVVEGHGNPNEIGRCGLWSSELDNCVHQNHLIRIRPHSQLNPTFAMHYLNSMKGRQFLLRSSNTTSGLNTISTSTVKASPIAVPPLELQQTFARRVAGVERLKEQHRTHLAELDTLFASLQYKAFKGEL